MANLANMTVKVTGDTQDFTRSLTSASSVVSGFATKATASLQKVMGGLGTLGIVAVAAGVAIVAGIGVGIKALFDLGQSFDKAYDRIQITTGATTKVMAGLKQSFKDTLEQVPNSMGDTADAVGGLNATLGLSGARLTEVSTSLLTFSRLTGTDVKQNVTDFSRVMGDWSISNADATLTMDKLLRTSQLTQIPMQQLMQTVVSYGAPMRSLGFSFEETIALLGKWQKEGVNTETVLRGMKQGIAQVAQDGGRFANVLREDFPEAFKQFEAASTLADRFRIGFNLVVDTFQKFGEVPAADLATKLFGARAGPDVFAAIREGRFEISDLVNKINDAGGAVSETARKTDDWSEKWDTLKNKLKVLFEPAAIAVFERVNDLLDSIFGDRKPTPKPKDAFGTEITGSVKDLNALLDQQKGKLKDLEFGAKITPTPEMLNRIQETKDSITRINDQLDRTDPKRLKALKKELKDLKLGQTVTPTDEMQNEISRLQKKIRDSLSQKPGEKSWWETVTDSFQHDFIDVMSEKATSFRLHFLEPWGSFGLEFADVFGDKGMAGQIQGAAGHVRDAITGIFDFDWFTTAREKVQDFFGNLPGWLLTFFTGPEMWLWEKGSSIIGGLLSGASAKFLEFLAWIGGIGWNVILWIGDAGVWLWQKGLDLIQGLWNGGTTKLGELLGWVGGLGGAVLGALGDLGGVLWEAGRSLMGGFADGMRWAWNGVIGFWNDHNEITFGGFDNPIPGLPDVPGFTLSLPDLPKFARGGIVPGAPGQGVPIMAHAGELVVPADQAQSMLGGVPGADAIADQSKNALAEQSKYIDQSTALLADFNAQQLDNQVGWQEQSIGGLTDTTTQLGDAWDAGLGRMVESTGTYLTMLNAGAQAQYGVLAFATATTAGQVVDTMTLGAAQAGDQFVGQLQARIPPLQSTLGGYSGSVLDYGRAFLGTIGVTAGFARGGINQAQIAGDGDWRVWAERGTGGEAYIPRHGANDPLGVLRTAASWYGYGVVPFQGGGLSLEELFWKDMAFDNGVAVPAVPDHWDHIHAGAVLGHVWQELDAFLASLGIQVGAPTAGQTTGGGHAAGSLHYAGRARDYGIGTDLGAAWAAFLPLATGGMAQALANPEVPAIPDFGPGVLGNGMSPGMAASMAEIMRFTMQVILQRKRDEAMQAMLAGGGGGGAFGDLQSYAGSRLGAFGWGPGELGALVQLWNKESGWNPAARNPTSGAWGIPQFLGADKGPVTANPYEQIDRGLAYIAQRYGSPSAAWSFWQSHGWYKQGGIKLADSGRLTLAPGLNAVYNGLGRPERMREGGSGEPHLEVNVTIEGNMYGNGEAERAFEAMYTRAGRQLARIMERKLKGE